MQQDTGRCCSSSSDCCSDCSVQLFSLSCRGFKVIKHETELIAFAKPGNFIVPPKTAADTQVKYATHAGPSSSTHSYTNWHLAFCCRLGHQIQIRSQGNRHPAPAPVPKMTQQVILIVILKLILNRSHIHVLGSKPKITKREIIATQAAPKTQVQKTAVTTSLIQPTLSLSRL